MNDEVEESKRGRGRPKKNGGHNTRIDVRLSSMDEEILKALEEKYDGRKSRSDIVRIALRSLYYS